LHECSPSTVTPALYLLRPIEEETVIDGLKVQFSSDELRNHLQSRVAYHRDKERLYADQVVALTAGGEQSKDASLDPIKALQNRGDSHRKRRDLFEVLVGHLVPDEIYQLSDSDLARLELISSHL
jgi:hypothetical protein